MATVTESIESMREEGQDLYDAVVAELAAGRIPGPKKAREALQATGRTLDDLQRDAQRLCDRQDAAKRLDDASRLVRSQARQFLQRTAPESIEADLAPFQAERRRLQTLVAGFGDYRRPEVIQVDLRRAVEKLGIMAGPSGGEVVLDGDSDAVGLLKVRIARLRDELRKAREVEAESAEPRAELARVEKDIAELEASKLIP